MMVAQQQGTQPTLEAGETANLWLRGLAPTYEGDTISDDDVTVEFDIVDGTRQVVVAAGPAVLESAGVWRRIVTMPTGVGTYIVRCTATVNGAVFHDQWKVKVIAY